MTQQHPGDADETARRSAEQDPTTTIAQAPATPDPSVGATVAPAHVAHSSDENYGQAGRPAPVTATGETVRERWSAKKSALAAALAIGTASVVSIGAAAAMPAGSSGGMGGPGGGMGGGPGGMAGTTQNQQGTNGQMGPGTQMPGGTTGSNGTGTTGGTGMNGGTGTTGGTGTQGQMPGGTTGSGQQGQMPGGAPGNGQAMGGTTTTH